MRERRGCTAFVLRFTPRAASSVAELVPPAHGRLTRFCGVFAPDANVRAWRSAVGQSASPSASLRTQSLPASSSTRPLRAREHAAEEPQVRGQCHRQQRPRHRGGIGNSTALFAPFHAVCGIAGGRCKPAMRRLARRAGGVFVVTHLSHQRFSRRFPACRQARCCGAVAASVFANDFPLPAAVSRAAGR